MTKNLQKILEFTGLLYKFREVVRTVSIPGSEREENDVEHSYMLAMQADYIISLEKLSLDRSKVMHYALVHDFVEAYAGDTYFYSKDQKHLDSKHIREAEALSKMRSEFPEHEVVWKTIDAYERREDDEAKFVYALDKIQPIIHINFDDGRSWRKYGVTLEQLIEKKADKVKIFPVIEKYWQELREILERNKEKYFG